MDDSQRLQLQNMIKANNVSDQTDLIRDLKHSQLIRNDVNNLILLKAKYRDDPERLTFESAVQCSFLFTYYTDIFNKVKKDEIDIELLNKLLDVLRKIEDGNMDQHEGSFMVGTILKEIYVDSSLKKAEKINEQYKDQEKEEPKKPEVQVSWKDFKQTRQFRKSKNIKLGL